MRNIGESVEILQAGPPVKDAGEEGVKLDQLTTGTPLGGEKALMLYTNDS